MHDVWLSPPVALAIFLMVAYGLYRLGGWLGATGETHPGKHQPYTGGEAPLPPPKHIGYHAFFKLALLFGILHMAALVLSTLPESVRSHRMAVIYLVGAAVSVFVLTGREE